METGNSAVAVNTTAVNNGAQHPPQQPPVPPANVAEKQLNSGETRTPILYVATGVKGVGKTYRTRKELERYAAGNPDRGIPPGKVVIFDVNDEYVRDKDFPYDIPTIDFDISAPKESMVAKHVIELKKPGLFRILPYNKRTGEAMTPQEKCHTAEILLKHVRNGMLVLEDLNNYMLGAKTVEVIGAITTNRHRDQDIIIHLQSACVLDPRLFQNTNTIRLHHQPDNFKRIANKITNLEMFEIAKTIVDTQYFAGNKRAFLYIQNIGNKITGVNEKIFIDGCKRYLMKNPREISNMMSQRGLDGKKMFTQEAAVEEWIKQRMHYISRD